MLSIGGVTDTFTSTTTASLPAAYVSQGGLTWMPNNIGPWSGLGYLGPGSTDWNTANTYCSTATINGQTGWRLPTRAELSSLYSSGALNGQGWTLLGTWTSSPVDDGGHFNIWLDSGNLNVGYGANDFRLVTCVR